MSTRLAETHRTDPRPLVVVLVGPTAVGKTQVSLKLAERLDGEIVSADSRLFYRGMDIGTAKPGLEERARVPHHLIDIVNPDETMSLAVFQERLHQAISEIVFRARLPIIVGGTGQYLRAVRSGWQPPSVAPNERLRLQLEALASDRGSGWLHERLAALDPQAAAKVDPRNVRRTVRALEVIMLTGLKFSEQRRAGESPYRLVTIGLRRSRTDLYARIDARIESMFDGGLIDETKRLLQAGYLPSLPAFSAIGYSQAVKVVRGEIDQQEAVLQMRRATRAFVRRQGNWFKDTDPSIHWLDATRPDLIDAIVECIGVAS